jgi:hypothetical protein
VLFFLSYRLPYSFSILCACCFNDNMLWGGSILVKSLWCSGGFLYLQNRMGISYSRFGKFSVNVLLNILQISFACTSSSMPIILRFGLLMESVSSYVFLSQVLSCLTNSSCFSFNFHFIFKF